jgi:hypothetical protein
MGSKLKGRPSGISQQSRSPGSFDALPLLMPVDVDPFIRRFAPREVPNRRRENLSTSGRPDTKSCRSSRKDVKILKRASLILLGRRVDPGSPQWRETCDFRPSVALAPSMKGATMQKKTNGYPWRADF